MYEVTYGARKGRSFTALADALNFAKKQVREVPAGVGVLIFDDAQVCVGVVTDDANGITLHRLIHQSHVDAADRPAWIAAEASPGFGR